MYEPKYPKLETDSQRRYRDDYTYRGTLPDQSYETGKAYRQKLISTKQIIPFNLVSPDSSYLTPDQVAQLRKKLIAVGLLKPKKSKTVEVSS